MTNAFVRELIGALPAAGKPGYVPYVVIDSGSTAWGAHAARVLRSALESVASPPSDTARYYARRIALNSIWISGSNASVSATWSLCNQRLVGEMYNWGSSEIAHSFVRTDTGWIAAGHTHGLFMDGHCEAYSRRQ